jgi:hypothetical protein
MTDPLDLPRLREAVALVQRAITGEDRWRAEWKDSGWPSTAPPAGSYSIQSTDTVLEWLRAVSVPLPALLDELEAERIENTHLREAFVTMERAYNTAQADLAAASDATGLAGVKAPLSLVDAIHQLKSDLAAARAVLETARLFYGHGGPTYTTVLVDRAAWLAWKERAR